MSDTPSQPPAGGRAGGQLTPPRQPGAPQLGQYSPDGFYWFNGQQWVPTQAPARYPPQPQYPPAGYPGYGYPPPIILAQQKPTNGAAKGCLIALGAGLAVLGVICILTLIGFIVGVVLIAIGAAIIIVGAVI
jgi:hypothetical protein